jgi:8-oxo-dGTP pyrophosphatase MutT (NUDIX family)
MSEPSTNEPVPIRPAATVMLVRDAEHGRIEVFMLRRTASAAFAGGMYVFPGGKVDAADGEGEIGFRVAAVREAFEEAGVLLARYTDGSPVTAGHPAFALRADVHAGSITFAELCGEHQLVPDVEGMHWVAHWLTPKGEAARRFDTRFYLAAAPTDQLLTHDDHETVDSLWTTPADALQRAEQGELMMMPPTVANLRFLAAHASVDAAMGAAAAVGTPPLILPKLRIGSDGRFAGVALPGDDDYDSLD